MLHKQALCAEASLHALRRTFPQIYASDLPLALDPAAVSVQRRDFLAALAHITPASHRSASAHARSVQALRKPCLHPFAGGLLASAIHGQDSGRVALS